jgi:hypothetical protein
MLVLDSFDSGLGTMPGFGEHGNEPLDFLKAGKITHQTPFLLGQLLPAL